ncbi:MAG: hypothetical protein R3F55_14690 [Alphaproteobacteria bacterium]
MPRRPGSPYPRGVVQGRGTGDAVLSTGMSTDRGSADFADAGVCFGAVVQWARGWIFDNAHYAPTNLSAMVTQSLYQMRNQQTGDVDRGGELTLENYGLASFRHPVTEPLTLWNVQGVGSKLRTYFGRIYDNVNGSRPDLPAGAGNRTLFFLSYDWVLRAGKASRAAHVLGLLAKRAPSKLVCVFDPNFGVFGYLNRDSFVADMVHSIETHYLSFDEDGVHSDLRTITFDVVFAPT